MTDFTNEAPIDLKDIPSLTETPKIKNDDIVYSSLLAGGSPVENYKSAKDEVLRTGTSTLVEDQIATWKKEQEDMQRPDIEAILADPNIPIKVKQKAALNYVSGNIPLQDLRDKYLTKQASVDSAFTEADRQAQDIYSQTVFERDAVKKQQAAAEAVERGKSEIGSILQEATIAAGKSGASIGSGLVLSIPAGIVGAFSLIAEQDPEKAAELVKIIQGYAYAPEGETTSDEASRSITEKISTFMETIDVPFQWLGNEVLEITDSPTAATAVYTVSSAIGYLGGAQLVKTGVKSSIKKGKISIPDASPLDTATTANKEAGSAIAVEAIKDETGTVVDALRTSKTAITNDYVLPKLEEEFGEIRPDLRVEIDKVNAELTKLYDDTELDANIAPVSVIKKERDAYVKVLTETTKPHLLLSSSVIGTTGKAFGRSGSGYEAILDTNYNKLEGTAVYGRNSHHGYKTQRGAEAYKAKLEEQTNHLPEKGEFNVLEKDGEFFVSWKFKREYNNWERLAFGADTLSAEFLHPKYDVTWFANSPIGDKVWPAYMRMREDIPAMGAVTAHKEARIEGKFIDAQRSLFMGTKHPKELVAMVRKGEQEGKVYTLDDFQTINQHLTKAQAEQVYAEYVGFRHVQDHLYRFADRSYRRQLQKDGMQNLYDADGQPLGFVSQPIKDTTGIASVWDITDKKIIQTPKDRVIVRLKEPVRVGDDILTYAALSPKNQFGPIRAGSLTKIPGYVPRHYKEWFVLDKIPTKLRVDGTTVAKGDLRNYSQAVAMGGTRSEIDQLLDNFKTENPSYEFVVRKEEKSIEDSIIHDSKVYDSYLKEHHKRGESLPSLGRSADVEDILVAQTRAIQGVSKITAWETLNEVTRKNFVKAYGKFTNHEFPDAINKIVPLKHMTAKEEMEFLAAQKVYQQWEMQQISATASDRMWRGTLNKVADGFEKMEIDARVLREWGEKGFVPTRAAKALGSNLFLYLRPIRMWFIQPQQWKELALVEPTFGKALKDTMPIMSGLMARSHMLTPLRSQVDAMGKRVTPDYDNIVNALEETGILQAVNMNQMIHGFWKDSLKELDPKTGIATKVLDVSGQIVKAPFKLGRRIGYDPAELTNQVTLWLFAKHRWQAKNPDKNWNLPENRAEISQLHQRLGHMASTRAGMYSWQDGNISLVTQFAAIPFKSMMQMISAKEFTPKERAKLAGARLFWYGKYGVPGGAALYSIIERNIEDEESKKEVNKYVDGATDIIWNGILSSMMDDNTNVAASKSMSTVPDSVWFYDLGETMLELAQGQATQNKFPFISAGSSFMTGVKGMYDLFALPTETGEEKDYSAITWHAVSFAGALSDYNKSQLAQQISKSGKALGYQQTAGEAIARLAGVSPEAEQALWEAIRDEGKREKYITDTAKDIHKRLVFYTRTMNDPMEAENRTNYIKGMQAFLARVEPSYRDELIEAIVKEDKRSHTTTKESIMKYLYNNAKMENDKHLQDMENKLIQVPDEDMQNLLKDLNTWRK